MSIAFQIVVVSTLVVIGAGSAGLSAAAGAAQFGLSVVLYEKGEMGGDCLNVGCVPSKGVIRAARAWAEVNNASEFGLHVSPDNIKRDFDAAMARKDKLLACGTAAAKPGCGVEVRFLNQPVRTLPPAAVYAHFIFGWHLTDQDARFVGNNLVAPEDDHIALRDYRLHMAQMGYLHVKLGDRNVSLHAGEVTLGLVHPDELRYHITEAVRTARADRIGHGIGIVYETGYQDLLAEMKERDIPVEINLTSNDVILGIKGEDHPYWIYKNAGVPVTLSTDDEGVSRIDLTHEYMRAADELHMDYAALKEISYNALKYAFVDEARKDELTAELDKRFAAFEAGFND